MTGQELPQVALPLPGPRAQAVIAKDEAWVSQSYSRLYPLVVERAKSAMLEDIDGNRFIDCSAGIGCNHAGHAPESVVRAIQAQAERAIHSGGMIFYSELMAECARRWAALMPGPGGKRVAFTTSGTESNDVAIKLARHKTGRDGIIYFTGSFHGRGLATLSYHGAGGSARVGAGALLAGGAAAPYPNPYRNIFGLQGKELVNACVGFVEHLLQTVSPPELTAAVLVEPVQSVSGFVWPPDEFLPRLHEVCQRHGILLIADEVFSGIGRTGRMFACEYSGVAPDILTTAKSIAGGLPMGMVIAREQVMSWGPGSHSATFTGNHVACAASLAILDMFEAQGLLQRTRMLGERALGRLARMQEHLPMIGNVSGRGLMIGIDLVRDRATREPASTESKAIARRMFERGVVLLPGGKSSIRLCPPATITEEQLDYVLDTFEDCLGQWSRAG